MHNLIMATLQTTVQENVSGELDLVNLVYSEATWKELLIELVDKNKLNPWEIDIVEIVDKYIDTVKKMKTIDLRVPANIILAAAILLRLKSSILSLEEEEQGMEGDAARIERPMVVVEGLNLRLRVPPKRRIALNELIEALDEAIKLKEQRIARINTPISVPIDIDNFDIELEADHVLEILNKHLDRSGMTTFSYMASLKDFNEVLFELFIPLLFLEHNGKISLMQEKFFDEIIISMARAS